MRNAILLMLLAVAANAAAAESPLVRAVKTGDAVAVGALLKQRVDVNVPEADGTTALHYAIQRNDADTVDALIRAGANVTAANRYGIAPLQVAATIGSAAIIDKLLAAGADPSSSTPEGETVLMTAARTGDAASVKLLASRGANVNVKEGWKGQTALMWAAAENNAAAMKVLIEAGAEVNARSRTGVFSPLLFAVRAGHVDASRVLLDAGADVNQLLADGTSPLVLATVNGHYELASFLLDRGAKPNADGQGWTALHQIVWTRRPNTGFNLPGAIATGNLDSLALARKLVTLGADVNARQKKEPKDGFRNQLNRMGATPFLLAAKSVDLPMMRVLLELGADPKITTEDGATALMAAAGVGIWAPGENPGTDDEAVAALKLAFEAGSDEVNAIDGNGETAVHGAVYRAGSIAMLSFLIEKGARLDVRNKKGWTPLIAADGVEYTPNVLKRYPDTAAFLRKAMAERGLPVPPPLDSPPGNRPAPADAAR
ncbi:MAG TPA: ankyrin repeat domain-containing protein [Vicinamibacterales bacterium]|nr:ankyrin repeat domain-containing protein [Vicinamibacterales bacterium]